MARERLHLLCDVNVTLGANGLTCQRELSLNGINNLVKLLKTPEEECQILQFIEFQKILSILIFDFLFDLI